LGFRSLSEGRLPDGARRPAAAGWERGRLAATVTRLRWRIGSALAGPAQPAWPAEAPAPADALAGTAAGSLAALARELTLTHDLPLLASQVVRRARSLCRADAALLYLQRNPAGPAVLLAADGFDADPEPSASWSASARAPVWLIQDRHPFVSNDTRRDPRVLYLGAGPRHLSVMYAPLSLGATGGEGALVVCARNAHAFTTAQLTLMGTLADQSSVAVANALLVAEAEERADRLAHVSRAGQRIAAQAEAGAVLGVCAEELSEVVDLAYASAVAVDGRGRVTAAAHHPGPLFDAALLGPIVGRDRALLVPDLRASDALPDLRLRLLERGVHSLAVVPVAHNGEVLGTLLLYATAGRGALTREAQELAGILAGQTAVALDQARLLRSAVDARRRGEGILQSSFTAIITADERLRVQDANAAAAELLGLPASYLNRRPLTEVLGATAWDVAGPILTEVLRSGQARPPVECVLGAGGAGWAGRAREVLLGVAPLPGGLVVSMTDITRLKEIDRLKSELVANVSHDLKAPLATIRTYAELLLEGLDEDDPALRRTFLRHIDAEVERLSGYITNLLDLARIEADGFQPRRERLGLAALLDETAATLRPRAAAADVTLLVELADPEAVLWVDRYLVRSLLVNLIDNAVKFSPPGGRVTVRAWLAEDGAHVAVADEGPGIAADQLAHVFEKFYRGSTSAEGSGLGLVIAQRAARSHGGEVTVTSRPGQGSEFRVSLPPTAVAAAGAREEALAGPA
jgi:signal transduction histidine kinase